MQSSGAVMLLPILLACTTISAIEAYATARNRLNVISIKPGVSPSPTKRPAQSGAHSALGITTTNNSNDALLQANRAELMRLQSSIEAKYDKLSDEAKKFLNNTNADETPFKEWADKYFDQAPKAIVGELEEYFYLMSSNAAKMRTLALPMMSKENQIVMRKIIDQIPEYPMDIKEARMLIAPDVEGGSQAYNEFYTIVEKIYNEDKNKPAQSGAHSALGKNTTNNLNDALLQVNRAELVRLVSRIDAKYDKLSDEAKKFLNDTNAEETPFKEWADKYFDQAPKAIVGELDEYYYLMSSNAAKMRTLALPMMSKENQIVMQKIIDIMPEYPKSIKDARMLIAPFAEGGIKADNEFYTIVEKIYNEDKNKIKN